MSLSLVARSVAQETKTDYDRNADFSRYKTFSFEKVETKDPLWVNRITAVVGAAVTPKGLTQVASGGTLPYGDGDAREEETSARQRSRRRLIKKVLSSLTLLTARPGRCTGVVPPAELVEQLHEKHQELG